MEIGELYGNRRNVRKYENCMGIGYLYGNKIFFGNRRVKTIVRKWENLWNLENCMEIGEL